MKKLLPIIIILVIECLAKQSFSQSQTNCTNLWNQARVWNFGQNAGLDFNFNPPAPLTNSAMNIGEGCASICDYNGNLLFYTDGNNVWNGISNSIVTTGLKGSYSSSQSASILPVPGNSSRYYIITTDAFAWGYLYYSVVDSTGTIVFPDSLNKNIILDSTERISEKLTAVRHSNNIDFWVISHEAHTNKFLIYLVDTNGVTLSSSPAIGLYYSSSWDQCPGVAKASCDGQKIAVATYLGSTVEIYDFDNTNGILSNPQSISFPNQYTYGLEFSPNNQFLYMGAESDSGYAVLSQINVSSLAVVPLLISNPPEVRRNSLQIGPDGKIYVTRGNTSFLGIIANPNQSGVACNYIDSGISLNGKICAAGLPNICWTTGCCNCTSIFFDNLQTICKGNSYVLNGHIYTETGNYYDTLISVNGCDSIIITHLLVNANPQTPVITVSNDTLMSDVAFGNQWYDSNGPIINATDDTYLPLVNGTYFVIVTDSNGCVSDTSNIISVSAGMTSSTDANNLVNIYPNPNSGNMTVNYMMDEAETGLFEIFNSAGQKLYSCTLHKGKHSITISDVTFSQGEYAFYAYHRNILFAKGKILVER